MELWIRSQNKTALMKIIDIRLYPDNVDNKTDIFIRDINGDIVSIGSYKTRERALEILDEISNKIKNQYIVKANCLIKPSDMMKEKEYLENTYDGDFIMQPSAYEIEPINPNVIYYEMPKE
jgi:hypothetical protein